METHQNPLYPIREVSRLTGVNTVTLRAWERRYGLITPQRTPKGHRLYSAEDIENVRRILQWLDKGVTVSQVNDLLDKPPEAIAPPEPAGDWLVLRMQFNACLQTLNEENLDALFCASFVRWSASQLAQAVFQPLLKQLDAATAAQGLLLRYLRTRAGERIQQRRKLLAGPKLLLCATEYNPSELTLTLLALSDLDFQVFWFDQPLSFNEIMHTAQQFKPQILLLGQGIYTSEDHKTLAISTNATVAELATLTDVNSITLYSLLREK
ncbi:MAG TPA: MerR family transcriptional regulator [Marinospirillum sp.]|uniref:MerR family transcriptional regulator n=1 Tax=Marinospirillum sp. TaxID=2183934 RepID=UPI002B4824BE|nr:MerR family transcriptional regulator [Marinospirillum sp.]HKM16289.1 MerR family transcriptional regulator [Marinospirillum sp.]